MSILYILCIYYEPRSTFKINYDKIFYKGKKQMKLSPVNSINNNASSAQTKKKPNYVKITGYAAVTAGIVSVIAIKNKSPKLHKNFAYLSGIFTAAHIGILEWYKHKKAPKKQENN